MQQYSLRSCICSLVLAEAVFDFRSNQNGLSDPKGNKNIICTMVKYGESFYGHHRAYDISSSEEK